LILAKTQNAAIDAPGGFLFEWWSVFWDIFIARTNEKHSENAAAYLEVAPFYIHLALMVLDTEIIHEPSRNSLAFT
jgi:hypothetical protein